MSICVSFSGMELYNSCPSAFNRRYILKEEVVGADAAPSAAAARGSRVHRDIELFLRGLGELPDEAMGFEGLFNALLEERQGVEPECHFAFDRDWEECDFADKETAKVRGILDICYPHDDMAYVIELKTGKLYEEHARQRSLYGLAGLIKYPECYAVTCQTIYLDGALVKPLVIQQDQRKSYQWVWDRLINKVQPPQPYPQRPSWKCRFCDYHEKKGGTCNGKST